MLNSGIGPILKKPTKGNQMMKRPPNQMAPNPNMYPMQMMNQYQSNQPPNMFPQKMPMPNMGSYPPNPMVMNKMEKPMPTMNPQQHNPNTIKLDPMAVQQNPKVQPMPTTTMPNPNLSNVSSPAQHQIKQTQGPGTGDKDNFKPSEIPTVSLTIGNKKIGQTNSKILTKLFFGKKLLIFEVVENGASSEEDKNNKKKYDIKFGDLEKFDVDNDGITVNIVSKEKPKEPKEGQVVKKSGQQWPKDSEDDHEEFGPPPYKIVVKFKESIKKTTPGKISHLDKIKRSDLPLTINGIVPQDSHPATPIKNTQEVMPNTMIYKIPNFNNREEFDEKNMHMQPNQNLPYRNSMLAQAQGHPNQQYESGHKDEKGEEHGPEGEEEEDEENPFPALTKEKKAEAKKFDAQLKNWKENEKIDFIMEMIKPKRTPMNPNSKKIYKCPLYSCQLTKANPSLLKLHLNQKHKSVMDLGLGIDDNGTFSWDPKLLDYVLMISKIYPRFVRNLIRDSKRSKTN